MMVWLTRSARISSASSGPPTIVDGTTTSVAPWENATIHSSTDGSKLGEHTCRKRARDVTPYRVTAVSRSGSRPAWVTTTPLGCPVDPDV